MLATIQSTIARHQMIARGARAIAAVSGGPDSVCLLHVLREMAPLMGFELAGVAHVNHKLRGEASDGDECFVQDLARSLELPFHSVTAPVRAEGNLEQVARRARRQFFGELIASGAAERIALGHTRDDQAETVLFRMLRGAGVAGLAGILPVTAEGLIRPLLDVRRADVLTYLRERGLRWREDESNQSPAFARNRIRHTLLPQLEREWNPRLTDALAHLADVSYEEELSRAAELARIAPAMLTPLDGAAEIDVALFAKLDRALQRSLLRHAMRLVKGNLAGVEFGHVETAVGLAGPGHGSARRSIPGLIAVRSFDRLLIARPGFGRPPEPLSIQGFGQYFWPIHKPLIHLDIAAESAAWHLAQDPYDTLRMALEEVMELRGWRAGDQYRPAGAGRAVKLKELFQQARVPSWRRAQWPILTSKGKILWAKDFGPAAAARDWRIREVTDFDESSGQETASLRAEGVKGVARSS